MDNLVPEVDFVESGALTLQTVLLCLFTAQVVQVA